MVKIRKYLICLMVMFLFVLHTEAVFAALEDDYPVRIWSADNMEVGNVTGVDGLEFLQPEDETAAKVEVKAEGRLPFKNAIKTRGSASLQGRFVPKTRALKFNVTKPCNIRIYAYGASSTEEVTLKISNSEKIVKIFATQHSQLERYEAYLETSGTYYIYGTGALGICEITVGYIQGDVDLDFDRDWNDLRLLRKAVNEGLQLNEMEFRNADMDKNSLIDENDLEHLSSCISGDVVSVREKAKFVSTAVWNANDMAVGNPEVYNGLEFVYVDGDVSNKTIGVINRNSRYVSQSGEVRNYIKCIETNGAVGEGYSNYPVSRAVKFNLDKDAYVTVYVSTGSSKPVQHKVQIMDADGNKEAEFNIDKNISCHTVKLKGNESYFVYSSTGKIRIYEIDVRTNSNESISKTINVEAGKNYVLYLTADKGVMLGKFPVKLTYNAAAITPVSMGAGSSVAVGNCNDRTIIKEIGQGYVVFMPYNWSDGDSGIMTDIVFNAKTSGTTTLTLSMQEG